MMSIWVIVAAVVIGGHFAYLLGGVLITLRAVHKELVLIRLVTQSLHDRVVPEVLMRRLDR